MKIRYNIANNKKIDYLRFGGITLLLIVFSILFVWIGVNQLALSALDFQREKNELAGYKDKIEQINQREAEQNKAVDLIKAKWGGKRTFLNQLIDSRLYPYIGKLDKLESLLPAGVFVKRIQLSVRSGDTVNVTIGAVSAQKLLQAYKVFLAHDLVISNETEAQGVFQAVISLTLN